MWIGERLRGLREQKNLSQGDIQKRTGLLRVYVSRVENGHTIPAIETLEKFARALDVPLYALFYDVEKPSTKPSSRDARDPKTRKLARFYRLLGKVTEGDRELLLFMANRMARRKRSK
jgi:transcriptional regulator with XRE-family HTH domain